MNVTLPDGSVIRNVPDGTTKAQLIEKLRANGYDVSGLTPKREATAKDKAVDSGNAVGTGFWRGAARLAGLPVDTAQNVIDLGKAGLGVAYREVTGNDIPEALTVNSDRSGVVGSGDWILKQARKTSGGRLMVDPANPEYEGGYLQGAGSSLAGGVVGPRSLPQLAHQAGLSIASASAGKAVGDLTDNPALAITASLTPAATQLAAMEGTRLAVRGGVKGRDQLRQRTQDLKNAGVDKPTLGLATGNQVIGGLENLLQNTPGAVGTMGRSRDAAIQGLRERTATAAETASPVRGSLESGQAIQSGIRGFRDRFKAKQGDLYARLDEHIDPMAPVDVTRTRQTLAALNEDIPGAPELSKQFKNGRIGEIERALLSDSGQIPTGTPTVTTRQILGATPQQTGVDIMGRPSFRGSPQGQFTIPGRTVEGGTPEVPYSVDLMGRRTPLVEPKPNTVNLPARTVRTFGRAPMTVDVMGRVVPAAPVIGFEQTVAAPRMTSTFSGLGVTSTPPTTLPFQAVRKTRTLVGNEIADTNLTSSVPRSKWSPLYGALADDMQAAADAAGPQAAGAYRRANDFTRSGMNRLDRVQPFVSPDAPEQSFQLLRRTLGENASTLQAVKKTLPQSARGTIAGTVIERLGKANPGQQNATGEAWSPETFLTNWNKMDPKARRELFSGFPNADKVRADVEAVAKATAMMRESSRMWANPSGTGANLAARVAIGAAPFSYLIDPTTAGIVAGGLGTTRLLSEALTSPASLRFFSSDAGLAGNTQGGLLLNAAKGDGQPEDWRRTRGLLSY